MKIERNSIKASIDICYFSGDAASQITAQESGNVTDLIGGYITAQR